MCVSGPAMLSSLPNSRVPQRPWLLFELDVVKADCPLRVALNPTQLSRLSSSQQGRHATSHYRTREQVV
jgi:hypothetical protein